MLITMHDGTQICWEKIDKMHTDDYDGKFCFTLWYGKAHIDVNKHEKYEFHFETKEERDKAYNKFLQFLDDNKLTLKFSL